MSSTNENEYLKEITQEYNEFYFKLKELYDLAIKYNFGNGVLPQVFTEKLCKKLFGLVDYKGKKKEFDASDLKGNNIEIKATVSKGGTTTMNLDSKFDFIYWMYFSFENNTLKIYKMSGEDFFNHENMKKFKKTKTERHTVSLGKILGESNIVYEYIFKLK